MVCTAQAGTVPTRACYGLLWVRQQESHSKDGEIETVRCDIRTDHFSLCSLPVGIAELPLMPLLMLWDIPVCPVLRCKIGRSIANAEHAYCVATSADQGLMTWPFNNFLGANASISLV